MFETGQKVWTTLLDSISIEESGCHIKPKMYIFDSYEINTNYMISILRSSRIEYVSSSSVYCDYESAILATSLRFVKYLENMVHDAVELYELEPRILDICNDISEQYAEKNPEKYLKIYLQING